MGGGYFSNAGVYLVDFVFGLLILAVLLRLLLQWVRADFYNPICQAIVTATNPVLRPLRRHIPSVGGVDTASLLLLLALQLTNTWLAMAIVGFEGSLLGITVVAGAELLSKAIWVFIVAIFVSIILSWVAQGMYNPIAGLIDALSAPLLDRARRLIPPLGGLDLSPLLPLLGLRLALMLVVAPLRDFGLSLL